MGGCDSKNTSSTSSGSGSGSCGGSTPCPPADPPGGESKTKDNHIDIVFDPDKSTKVKKCEKIVHVQFIQMVADGKAIKPGDYYTDYKYRDPVTTGDGWYVDHVKGEVTPDYQQGTGNGHKNGGSGKAQISDGPQTGGGDKGFYDASTNPSGWKTVTYKFVSFAYCMKGDDCGKWYEGVEWEYTKTSDDQKNGKLGESKITNKNVTSEPSKSQKEAFEKFNKDKGHTPCK